MGVGRLFVLLACEPLCGDGDFVASKIREVAEPRLGSGPFRWCDVAVVYRCGTPAEAHAAHLASLGAERIPFRANYRTQATKAHAENACDKRMAAEVSGCRGVMVGFWNGRFRGLRNVFGYAKASGLERVQVEFTPSPQTGQMRLDV